MAAKREKLNNSAIVGSANDASLLSGSSNMMMQNTSTMSTQMKQMQHQRRTPTSLIVGSSQDNMSGQQLNSSQVMSSFATPNQTKSINHQRQSKDKNLKITHQSILNQHLQEIPINTNTGGKGQLSMGHHMNFSTNPTNTTTSKAHMAGHLH